MTQACTSSPKTRSASILVADGCNFVRRPLAMTLQREGYEVVEAASAAEASQLLATWRFDAAVLDRVLRNGTSGEIADKLEVMGIPFFFLTADRRSGSDWGWHEAAEQLLEPASPDEIIAAVKCLLDKNDDANPEEALRCSNSAAFKRQVAEDFIAREPLLASSQLRDIPRQMIRSSIGKSEAGALDNSVQAADLMVEGYQAKIVALERMVGRQALEIELLEGALKHAPRQPPLSPATCHLDRQGVRADRG